MTATDLAPSAPPADLADLADLAGRVGGDVERAVVLAREVGRWLPPPGGGRTAQRWAYLRDLAAADLTAARVVEAHTDALAILAEAAASGYDREPGRSDPGARSWGVFAAEGPGVRVDAERTGDGWSLTGTKPWCSLADRLDAALITAHVPGGGRRLFAVDLSGGASAGRVRVDPPSGWAARGLVEVTSTSVHLDRCPADPIGPDGWYLNRPGFAWGGIGVAACWLGGALGVGRKLFDTNRSREPDQIALMHLGAVDAAIFTAEVVLRDAARAVDDGSADGEAGGLCATRARAVVAATVDIVLLRVGHALGPAPLAFDDEHARRVADLQLYVRQHHAERDEAALGALVRDRRTWP